MVNDSAHEHSILRDPSVHYKRTGTDNVGPHPLVGFFFSGKSVDFHNGLNVWEHASSFADVGHNLSERMAGEAVPSDTEVVIVQWLKVADGDVNAA